MRTPDRLGILLGLVGVAAGAIPCTAQETVGEQLVEPRAGTSEARDDYIRSLRNARNALLIANDYQAARSPAETLVDELASEEDPNRIGDEIVLASIFVELGLMDAAEMRFFDILDRLESEEGGFSPTLIEPLHYLGRSYIKARMFPQAISALEQAQFISQRNEGLFNVEQSTLIDDMTTAYLGMGDTLAAQELQQERLENAQRRFGAKDPQVVPFHKELAHYYQQSRLNSRAREQLEAALEIQEAAVGRDDPSVLQDLQNIAAIDLLLGDRMATKERIEKLLEGNATLPLKDRGYALAFLGDWAITEGEQEDAAAYYEQAYRLLQESGDVDVEEIFADPALISFSPPLTPVDRGTRRLPYAWGTIVLEFDVTDAGRVAEFTGVGAEPPDIMERAYVDRLEHAFFRPRIVDGEPVAASGIRFTHYFRYYVESDSEDSDER